MSHIPVNHPLRPLYRTLAALIGVFVLIFGLVGLVQTMGDGLFDRGDAAVLGIQTNLAFSLLSVLSGAVVLLAAVFGRNVDRFVNLWGGQAFIVAGLVMLALLSTDLNVLNFSMSTVIVSFVIGMVLFAAGLYGRSAPVKAAVRAPAKAGATT